MTCFKLRDGASSINLAISAFFLGFPAAEF